MIVVPIMVARGSRTRAILGRASATRTIEGIPDDELSLRPRHVPCGALVIMKSYAVACSLLFALGGG
jgi:hypothetical protein